MKYARINVFISFLLCFLAGSIKVIAVEGVTPEEFHTVNKGLRPTDVSDYTLWYDTPATKSGASDIWMEYALPMGNGQIGATIVVGLPFLPVRERRPDNRLPVRPVPAGRSDSGQLHDPSGTHGHRTARCDDPSDG